MTLERLKNYRHSQRRIVEEITNVTGFISERS